MKDNFDFTSILKDDKISDGSIEALLKVLQKYWPDTIADVTSSGDGSDSYVTVKFNFINNYDSDNIFSTGRVTFWRPQCFSSPTMTVDIMSTKECNETTDWSEGYSFKDHLMNLDCPYW